MFVRQDCILLTGYTNKVEYRYFKNFISAANYYQNQPILINGYNFVESGEKLYSFNTKDFKIEQYFNTSGKFFIKAYHIDDEGIATRIVDICEIPSSTNIDIDYGNNFSIIKRYTFDNDKSIYKVLKVFKNKVEADEELRKLIKEDRKNKKRYDIDHNCQLTLEVI